MRETKFKIWDKYEKVMREVESIYWDDEGKICDVEFYNKVIKTSESLPIEKVELLQFTCLL